MPTPVDLFFSYSHADETLRQQLETHLALLQKQGVIRAWYDRKILAGQDWQAALDERLETARVILLLVSADFLASTYCYDIEMTRALERHDAGEVTVIPIILRPCDWSSAPFAKLQAFPTDATPVTSWPERDAAWTSVAIGIRAALAKPRYPDAATPVLGEELKDATARRQELEKAGGSTAEVDREILELRRKLQGGGQLRAGDSLGGGRHLLDNAPSSASSEVGENVEALIQALSSLRKTSEGALGYPAQKSAIDALVAKIKRGFHPHEGTKVANATLLRGIGNGNFGTVWEARQDDGTIVAVKVFHLYRLAEGQMVSRFRRSIRAMRILTEARRTERRDDLRGHIVPFYSADDSHLAFSMKLLTGGDLEQLERLGWTLEKKLNVMLSICAAVAYSHKHGIIHRDIKPANVVLDEEGRAVLTDFDIADIKFATGLSTTVEKSLGTPVFAAPEQLEDANSASELADIYSLGRVLYFFLLERSPGYQIEKDPTLENLSKFPVAMVEIVRKATQFDPKKRFPSVEALMTALEGCQSGAAAWRARASRARRWARHSWAALSIAGILILASSGAAFFQRRFAVEQMALRVKAELSQRQAEESRQEQEKLRVQADEARRALEALSDKLTASIRAKDTAVERHEVAKAEVASLQEQYKLSKTPDLRERLSKAEDALKVATATLERLKKQQDELAAKLTEAKARATGRRTIPEPQDVALVPTDIPVAVAAAQGVVSLSQSCRARAEVKSVNGPMWNSGHHGVLSYTTPLEACTSPTSAATEERQENGFWHYKIDYGDMNFALCRCRQ